MCVFYKLLYKSRNGWRTSLFGSQIIFFLKLIWKFQEKVRNFTIEFSEFRVSCRVFKTLFTALNTHKIGF